MDVALFGEDLPYVIFHSVSRLALFVYDVTSGNEGKNNDMRLIPPKPEWCCGAVCLRRKCFE